MSQLFSLVIPVYGNEGSISELISTIETLAAAVRRRFDMNLEAIFVVDGSPDNSFLELSNRLGQATFPSTLLSHSRNFGSFAAIRTGLNSARGNYFGVMAADLQEPPELMLDFIDGFTSDQFDVMVGARESRADPIGSKLASGLFWRFYRAFVMPELPVGGVDVFGCNRVFRDHLLALEEAHSSLVGLIFWLGFRRGEVHYSRRPRVHGRSGWSLRKKIKYLLDSVFSFTDLPIRMLTLFGLIGLIISVPMGLYIIAARVSGVINVPGYAATMVAVIFFGAINSIGLGIIGSYAWRTYENTKRRPLSLVLSEKNFNRG